MSRRNSGSKKKSIATWWGGGGGGGFGGGGLGWLCALIRGFRADRTELLEAAPRQGFVSGRRSPPDQPREDAGNGSTKICFGSNAQVGKLFTAYDGPLICSEKESRDVRGSGSSDTSEKKKNPEGKLRNQKKHPSHFGDRKRVKRNGETRRGKPALL